MVLVALFKMFLSLSFMGSILAVIIILTKLIFKSQLNANWHYYIWFLLIIRLIVPYAPYSSLSVFNIFPISSQTMEESQYTSENLSKNVPFPSINKQPSVNIISSTNINSIENKSKEKETIAITKQNKIEFTYDILGVIWLIGVIAILLYICIFYTIFLFKINKQQQCKDPDISKIFAHCKSEMNVTTSIPIIYNNILMTPSLFGIVRHKLLIPSKILEQLSKEELRYVFMHELAHIKRMDTLLNMVIMFVLSLHWFNPLMWYAFYKMKEDCEAACDAYVLSKLTPTEQRSYGNTIINLIDRISRSHWNPVCPGMVNNCSSAKRRIIMISLFKSNISWKHSVISFVLLIVILITGMTKGYNSILFIDDAPKINITAEIRNLTQEEFSEVGTKGLENPSINDFRKFTLNAEITNAKNVSNKNLIVPDIGKLDMALRKLDIALNKAEARLWFGESSDQNNTSEDFSRSERSMVIYYKGLSEDDVREMMKPLKIQILWTTKDGINVDKNYSVGELITFEKEEQSDTENISLSDIEEGKQLIEKHFRAYKSKDLVEFNKTLGKYKKGLFNEQNISDKYELLSIDYPGKYTKDQLPPKSFIATYGKDPYKAMNLHVRYKYEGEEKDWDYILIKEAEESPWEIHDWGY